MLRLAVTRTSEQLANLTERAAARGVTVIALSVIAIQQLPFDWPDKVNAEDINWVFFSSANGVAAFFKRLCQLGVTLGSKVKFAAVGKKTAQALEDLGYRADFVPSDAYGQIFFEEFADSVAQKGPVIYARGAEVNYDPAELFAARGIQYFPVVCYETTSQPVALETISQLTRSDYILFTAPSTVVAYHEQFGKPLAKPIAIGRSTAAQMNQFGWFGFITMKNADIDNILEYL